MIGYAQLEPLEQFEIVCMISSACCIGAAALREFFADREIRIAARALGLMGYVLLLSFGWRMASKAQTLEQIARANNAPTIADQIADMAHSEAHEITEVRTPNGTLVVLGGARPVSTPIRRFGGSGDGRGHNTSGIFCSPEYSATTSHGTADVPHDAPVRF